MTVRLAMHLAQEIDLLPSGSVILLRRGRTTPLGLFESVVSQLAGSAGLKVDYRVPEPGNRSSVYLRDYQMVDDCNYVEAYFWSDRVMDGGTGHVVEAALNREKRVYAWSVDSEGHIERVGEFEPTSID